MDEAVCIQNRANSIQKIMNQTMIPPAMGK